MVSHTFILTKANSLPPAFVCSLTYNIVCTEFINLIAPLLWSMFFISIFSMIMVTLRVAWHELAEDTDVGNTKNGVNEEEEDIAENEGDTVEKLDTVVDERGDDVVENPIQDNESSEQEDGQEENSTGTGNKAQSDDGDDNLEIQKDNVDEEKEENDDTFKEESG